MATIHLSVNELMIEADIAWIAEALNKEKPPSWFLLSPLRECFTLLNLIVEWRVIHTFREGNQYPTDLSLVPKI